MRLQYPYYIFLRDDVTYFIEMVFTEPVFYKVIIQCPLCTVPDLDLAYGRYELNKSDIVNHLLYASTL